MALKVYNNLLYKINKGSVLKVLIGGPRIIYLRKNLTSNLGVCMVHLFRSSNMSKVLEKQRTFIPKFRYKFSNTAAT